MSVRERGRDDENSSDLYSISTKLETRNYDLGVLFLDNFIREKSI